MMMWMNCQMRFLMENKRIPVLLILCFFILTLSQTVYAQIPPRPSVATAVNDFAGIFTPRQRISMENMLVSFADTTSNRIVVVTVNDLGGYEPAMFAYEIGEQWGVGDARFDNGVVLLVKPKTSSSKGQTYIAVGYGLEGVIPDAVAKRIVERELIPHFQEDDYYGGVEAALEVIMDLASGEYSYEEYGKLGAGFYITLMAIFLFVVILTVVLVKNGATDIHSGGATRRGGTVYWGSSGGFRGGSFGSGGFGGGFGGGSFGGGGAGGSW